MRKFILSTVTFTTFFFSCSDLKKKEETKKGNENLIETSNENSLKISPISHATAVLEFNGKTVYIDPTGGKEAFEGFANPDMIFITDVHGDHMNMKTLKELDISKTTIISPSAVFSKLTSLAPKNSIVINNGESKDLEALKVEAIPMYNLREEALKFHTKGRGNGYVFTINGERIYFSGDTEDIPEMRSLKNIDKAFICMNLPYTMTVESAASAVLDFKPKQVYPYHYRGTDGMSDVVKFKSIINTANTDIEVVQLNWYQ